MVRVDFTVVVYIDTHEGRAPRCRYVAIEEAEKRKIENEVHRLVTNRDAKFTNFVEVSLPSVTCNCLRTGVATTLIPCSFEHTRSYIEDTRASL
jgi:hypothetical protein